MNSSIKVNGQNGATPTDQTKGASPEAKIQINIPKRRDGLSTRSINGRTTVEVDINNLINEINDGSYKKNYLSFWERFCAFFAGLVDRNAGIKYLVNHIADDDNKADFVKTILMQLPNEKNNPQNEKFLLKILSEILRSSENLASESEKDIPLIKKFQSLGEETQETKEAKETILYIIEKIGHKSEESAEVKTLHSCLRCLILNPAGAPKYPIFEAVIRQLPSISNEEVKETLHYFLGKLKSAPMATLSRPPKGVLDEMSEGGKVAIIKAIGDTLPAFQLNDANEGTLSADGKILRNILSNEKLWRNYSSSFSYDFSIPTILDLLSYITKISGKSYVTGGFNANISAKIDNKQKAEIALEIISGKKSDLYKFLPDLFSEQDSSKQKSKIASDIIHTLPEIKDEKTKEPLYLTLSKLLDHVSDEDKTTFALYGVEQLSEGKNWIYVSTILHQKDFWINFPSEQKSGVILKAVDKLSSTSDKNGRMSLTHLLKLENLWEGVPSKGKVLPAQIIIDKLSEISNDDNKKLLLDVLLQENLWSNISKKDEFDIIKYSWEHTLESNPLFLPTQLCGYISAQNKANAVLTIIADLVKIKNQETRIIICNALKGLVNEMKSDEKINIATTIVNNLNKFQDDNDKKELHDLLFSNELLNGLTDEDRLNIALNIIGNYLLQTESSDTDMEALFVALRDKLLIGLNKDNIEALEQQISNLKEDFQGNEKLISFLNKLDEWNKNKLNEWKERFGSVSNTPPSSK